MAKYYGAIGFAESEETSPGIHKELITEHNYYGDLIQNIRRLQTTDKVNDDIDISNRVSIVADAYANQNFHAMRYAEFMGARWKITNVDVQPPRLILTLGGLYNG